MSGALGSGCGGGGSAGGDDRVATFLGAWTFAPGSTYTSDCSEDGLDRMFEITTTIPFQLVAGTASDLTEPDMFFTCAPLQLDVAGSTASAPDQMCSVSGEGAFDERVVRFAFELDEAGTTVTVSGELSSATRATPPVTCTHVIDGVAMKSPAS